MFQEKRISKRKSLQSAKSKQAEKTQEARIFTDPTKILKLLTKKKEREKKIVALLRV